jgi:hypothetical protein
VPQPAQQVRRAFDGPAVSAILERARSPYLKNPLSEDEALNLIVDARESEPTYPMKRLLKKTHRDMGD